jgi:membrane-bound lytic murein transglycosylase F
MALLTLALMACSQEPPEKAVSKPVKDDKVITFVTINSATTYYLNGQDEYAGLEYELAKRYVASLGPEYQIKFIVVDSFSKVIPTLLAGEADIAAADITITEDRQQVVNFSTPYHDVQQQIAYNRDVSPAPKSLERLEGLSISVPAGTSYAERLHKLSIEKPGLVWEEVQDTSSEQLLEALANDEIRYTVTDSHLLAVMQNYHPNLSSAFALGKPEKIAWAVAKQSPPERLAKINAFFLKIKQDGTLSNLIDRYHGSSKRLNPLDIRTFIARSQTLLPKYIRLFKDAQEITDIDWRLLAALSYQESHWDTYNTSPTNVRGLMMLTESTSDLMHVTDRLDPKQSIPAGAKYLLWLKERFPERIPEPDRTFLALAAYNIGFGHVEDARVLAQRLKMNPDSWADVKKTLLKLTDPTYYTKAKHGYCSCGAPVIYTESIRSYYRILEKHQPRHLPELAPFNIASR